jgi:hypothetical protein
MKSCLAGSILSLACRPAFFGSVPFPIILPLFVPGKPLYGVWLRDEEREQKRPSAREGDGTEP